MVIGLVHFEDALSIRTSHSAFMKWLSLHVQLLRSRLCTPST
jgi:hypothetical protein